MKRNTEMFCANKPSKNSFHSQSIQTEVLFFNFYILQASAAAAAAVAVAAAVAAIQGWLQAKYCSH
jgi:hypothetical protein